MRNFRTLGVLAQAVIKYLAASLSMAYVRLEPPLPPAPSFERQGKQFQRVSSISWRIRSIPADQTTYSGLASSMILPAC